MYEDSNFSTSLSIVSVFLILAILLLPLVASVVSDFVRPYGLQPVRLLCPWDSVSRSTRVGCHGLLQGSSGPRDQTWVSCIAGRFFTPEPPRKYHSVILIYVWGNDVVHLFICLLAGLRSFFFFFGSSGSLLLYVGFLWLQ